MRTLIRHTAGLITALVALCIISTAPALAQDPQNDLASDPGYVDLSTFSEWFDGKQPSIQVDITPALLNLLAGSSKDSDPEFASLMGKLRAIQVRGYETQGINLANLTERADEFAQQLERQGWERVVRIQQDNEYVGIFTRASGDNLAGLTIMTVEPEDETVFVNIVGQITPEQIQKLGNGLNIDSINDLDIDESQANNDQ